MLCRGSPTASGVYPVTEQYREALFATGSSSILNGVFCEPVDADRVGVCILFLNAGLIHRVGMGRFAVKLARHFASSGFVSCRFDFPGVGDSTALQARHSHLTAAPGEVSSVIDALERETGLTRFVLWGICDGADAGFVAALHDQRVEGVVQVDPILYRTGRWYWNHYGQRVFSPLFWRERLTRFMVSGKSDASGALDAESYRFSFESSVSAREMLSKLELEEGYGALVSRNVRLLIIITGGCSYTYNYAGQFFDSFTSLRHSDKVTLQYLPNASHILAESISQSAVKAKLGDWLQRLS